MPQQLGIQAKAINFEPVPNETSPIVIVVGAGLFWGFRPADGVGTWEVFDAASTTLTGLSPIDRGKVVGDALALGQLNQPVGFANGLVVRSPDTSPAGAPPLGLIWYEEF